MGMTAEILAVGLFQPELAKHLSFPEEFYAATQAGAPVIRSLFHCCASSESRALAECFGIDPWDFSQHKLDPYRVNTFVLLSNSPNGFVWFGDKLQPVTWSFDITAEWQKFVAFREAGFDFYFLPNG